VLKISSRDSVEQVAGDGRRTREEAASASRDKLIDEHRSEAKKGAKSCTNVLFRRLGLETVES
jgi:hypothetical protein